MPISHLLSKFQNAITPQLKIVITHFSTHFIFTMNVRNNYYASYLSSSLSRASRYTTTYFVNVIHQTSRFVIFAYYAGHCCDIKLFYQITLGHFTVTEIHTSVLGLSGSAKWWWEMYSRMLVLLPTTVKETARFRIPVCA